VVILAAGGSTRLDEPEAVARAGGENACCAGAGGSAVESRCEKVAVVVGAEANVCGAELRGAGEDH